MHDSQLRAISFSKNVPTSRNETIRSFLTLKTLPFLQLVSQSTNICLAFMSGDVLGTGESAVNEDSALKKLTF